MRFDDLPSAWQKENERSLSPDVREAMIVRVCRRVERIGGKIFRRDLVETIAAIVVFFSFGWMAVSLDGLVARIGAGVVAVWSLFIIWKLHRTRTIQRPAPIDAPVHEFCRIELERLDRQIDLLRGVLWWYIAPCIIGVNIVFIGTTGFGVAARAYLVGTLLLAWGIYLLNMRAVAKTLVPPRDELANLLSQLDDAGPGVAAAGQYGLSSTEQRADRSSMLGRLLLPVVALAALGYIVSVVVDESAQYPKRAPFTGVRWEDDQPVVKVGDEWFRLVSLDGIAAKDIVSSSRWRYGYKWQKRFEEDLVEVLSRMGHPPQDKVTLVVQSLTSETTQTLVGVPMTEANRSVVYRAALAHKRAQEPFADLIAELRKVNNLVGLAAMVTVDGRVVASAVDGERKVGSGVRPEIGDRWHLGGITKSVTATMIARLIESGKMNWSDTVGKVFPEASVHDDWKRVTLEQLLTDTAGAPVSFSISVRRQWPALGAERTQSRREAVLKVLGQPPETAPGTKSEYSNVGYTIVGAMAEKVTGAAWEDLVKREVFEPLKLTAAGFGPPKSSDEKIEQPRGHREKIAVGDKADNTPIMGPAGTVHMSLEDLCTFAREHLLGDRGKGQLLSAATYKRLHTPGLDAYACGWIKNGPSDEIPYTVYWHNGSNTMWYAMVAFVPETNMVVAVASNDGNSSRAEAAAWEIVKVSANRWAAEAQTKAVEKESP